MEKVKLPKDVAIALDQVIKKRGRGWCQNLPVISNAAKNNHDLKILVYFIKSNEKGYETLQKATYVGYEAERTT
jgi:hypothetical protein